MEKLEKLLSAKWVLFVASALVVALNIGQEIYLSGGRMGVDAAALGIVASLCCGAFCELVRKTVYGTGYDLANVGVWVAAAVTETVISLLVW